MSSNRSLSDLATFLYKPQIYGKTITGSQLWYFPSIYSCKRIFIAGIHGEEADSTMLLSRAIRLLNQQLPNTGVILCANPDGMQLGTRGNFNGVDLNRNFPSKNWQTNPVLTRFYMDGPRVTTLSPGDYPESESETKALVALISHLQPQEIVALHSPLACIDAQPITALAKRFSSALELPLVDNIGFATPGSLGSYCLDLQIPCTTIELPKMPLEDLCLRYSDIISQFLMD